MTAPAPEPIALNWSGGKDSALALAALRADPSVRVVALLTNVVAGDERVSVHGVRRALVRAQASAAGLPLVEVMLPAQPSNAAYEAAFADGAARVRQAHPGVRRIAFGDLFLADIRAYREQLVAQVGMEAAFPLWGLDTRRLAERFIADGFRAHLVCVDTTQLDASFAGRAFDAALLADLPVGVDPCGENGEFHTFVHAGPVFDREIGVRPGRVTVPDGRFAYSDLLPPE